MLIKVLRGIAGLLVGAALTLVLVLVGEMVLTAIAPYPKNVDAATMMATASLASKLGLLVVYFLAALISTLTAAAAAGGRWAGWITGLLFIGLTIWNFATIPHPIWMVVSGLAVIALASWMGPRWGAKA